MWPFLSLIGVIGIGIGWSIFIWKHCCWALFCVVSGVVSAIVLYYLSLSYLGGNFYLGTIVSFGMPIIREIYSEIGTIIETIENPFV